MNHPYLAPLRDMRFVIEHVLGAPASWQACPASADLDMDTASAVLEEAAKFASGVLQPLNTSGDQQGCRLQPGAVHTPQGFAEAYQTFVEGGWPALACSPEWGGQGLPLLLDAALREMLSACNHGWTMYPDLLHGAYETIRAHGSEEVKARYLEDVATGRTLAAMALTEPQAGSDLGRLSTRAEGQSDGSLLITGSKIFISGADHDLTEQIVHLVLCRFADAPPGSRGLSLALVPKWLPHGSRNAWAVTGLEHKMGIHGSATCAVAYDGATGWRVGEPNGGLAAMFLMMNSARLHVGLQGLGHQEMATQTALAYAFDRVQGGRVVAEHAAVRKILLRLQSLTEAQRVIAYRAALAIDEAEHHPSAARRAEQKRIAGLLTPLVKAYCTAQGFQGASEALQVLGGYGYLRDYGLEQSLRDVRIAMVYEGTNEIQAIDLVKRKLLGDGGEGLGLLLAEFEADAQRCLGAPGLDDFGTALQTQMAAAHASLEALGAQARNDPEAPLRLADEMLQGMAHLLLAWAWARSAWATQALADRAWAEAKLARMRFGIEWLLPQAEVHWARVQSGGSALPLPALPDRS